MNVTPKTHAVQVRNAAARKSAVTQDVRVLAYTSATGLPTGQERAQARCAAQGHPMVEVEADLPGDRTIGYCACGGYIDTGTWDERN